MQTPLFPNITPGGQPAASVPPTAPSCPAAGLFPPSEYVDTPQAWQTALAAFLRSLEAKNRSPLTIRAYHTDLWQFLAWLEHNSYAPEPAKVERADITEYLASLGQQKRTGVTRARKLAAIREFFRFLEDHEQIAKNPTKGVETPRKERITRKAWSQEEYRALLAQAGAHPRDYAILQVFLQTGIRVSELCDLRLGDVDLAEKRLTVRGKGQQERQLPLAAKAREALQNYLTVRPQPVLPAEDHLFLTKAGRPLKRRVVHKLVAKYKRKAGITKQGSCHTFRHTFGSQKARQGVPPWILKEWLGHKRLDTTQLYVHMAGIDDGKIMELTSL
jgi:integrase/recombinase XerD